MRNEQVRIPWEDPPSRLLPLLLSPHNPLFVLKIYAILLSSSGMQHSLLSNSATPVTPGDAQMALVLCPECDGLVSDTASACPHCGCDFELYDEEEEEEDGWQWTNVYSTRRAVYTVVVLLLILFGAAWYFGFIDVPALFDKMWLFLRTH